jgi:hypothetical protein
MDLTSYEAIIRYFLVINNVGYWIGWVIFALVLSTLSISILYGALDRHMRVGDFTLTRAVIEKRLNFNLVTALKFVITSYITVITAIVLLTALVFMYVNIMPLTAAWVFTVLTCILLMFCVILVFAIILVWPPYMLHTGLSSSKAFALSVTKTSKKLLQLSAPIIAPAVPIITAMMVNSMLNLKLDVILDTIMYVMLNCFYLVFVYTYFFEIEGKERADINKRSYLEKNLIRGNIWNIKNSSSILISKFDIVYRVILYVAIALIFGFRPWDSVVNYRNKFESRCIPNPA